MTTKRIIVFGEGILNNIKDVDGYGMVFIDSKNEGENVYNSLYKYLLTNVFSNFDIFISFIHNSPLSFRLDYSFISRDNIVITTQSFDLAHIIEEDQEEVNDNDDYEFFKGGKILSRKKEVKVEILIKMKELAYLTYQMMDAGYLEMENNKKIPDWIVTFKDPLQDYFIQYHEYPTSNDSVTVEEEFLINPVFRKDILVAFMKILANFIVNNKMGAIDFVSEETDGWMSRETWKKLEEKIPLLKQPKTEKVKK